MTRNEKTKILRAMIATGIGAAGLGAFVRHVVSASKRKVKLDADESKNAITVGVNKGAFMDGLPSPDEQAALVGERQDLTKDASCGRALSFFRKSDKRGKPVAKDKLGEKKPGSRSSDDNGMPVMRGQNGQFAGGACVEGNGCSEKSANVISDVIDTLSHPSDSLRRVWDSATDAPVAYTAGALGGVYLATLLADGINKIRRNRSKALAEKEKDRYMNMIGRKEVKQAQDKSGSDIRDWAGIGLGTAFIVPAALSAIIVGRILSNRRQEAKRRKEISNSIPEEPIFLYQTHDGASMPVSPDTALASILSKRAMIESMERSYIMPNMEKSASNIWQNIARLFSMDKRLKYARGAHARDMNDPRMSAAVGDTINFFSKPKNNAYLLKIKNMAEAGDMAGASRYFEKILPQNMKKLHYKMYLNKGFLPNLMGNGRFQDLIVENYNNDKYKDTWGKDKSSKISNYVATELGFEKGGLLHTILSFLMNKFGTGMFNSRLRERMRSGSADMWNKAVSKGGGKGATAAPATPIAPTAPTDPKESFQSDPNLVFDKNKGRYVTRAARAKESATPKPSARAGTSETSPIGIMGNVT